MLEVSKPAQSDSVVSE